MVDRHRQIGVPMIWFLLAIPVALAIGGIIYLALIEPIEQ